MQAQQSLYKVLLFPFFESRTLALLDSIKWAVFVSSSSWATGVAVGPFQYNETMHITCSNL